jgi:hypothetical protein
LCRRGNKSPAPPAVTAPRGGELNPQRLKKKAAYIRQFLEANRGKERIGESGNEIQSNVTDNGSAKIKGPHGVIHGYTGIAAADSKAQVIVCAEAHGTDCEGGYFPEYRII